MFQVPLLFASGVIIKRVGAVPCLYLAMLAVALRFLGYSLLSNPWVVLVIEPLHGVTFGIMWAAASTYAAMIAPPGMSATIQGLVSGVHFGIGVCGWACVRERACVCVRVRVRCHELSTRRLSKTAHLKRVINIRARV